jgi:hypothetical protein
VRGKQGVGPVQGRHEFVVLLVHTTTVVMSALSTKAMMTMPATMLALHSVAASIRSRVIHSGGGQLARSLSALSSSSSSASASSSSSASSTSTSSSTSASASTSAHGVPLRVLPASGPSLGDFIAAASSTGAACGGGGGGGVGDDDVSSVSEAAIVTPVKRCGSPALAIALIIITIVIRPWS